MGAPARAPRTGRRSAAAAACLGCCLLAACGGGIWIFLGADRQAPYEWTVPVPADGRTTLEVFARATDRSGAQADSAIVVVAVRT